WGRSLSRSLLFCFRKDVALVSHCVPSLGRGTRNGEHLRGKPGTVLGLNYRDLGDGTFHVHRLVSGVASAEFAILLS
ncbi:MAG TPA: hypothetical protein VMV58_00045, partial [Desulfosporosinus sp.]|nr:hypothetical protein [Desulfosporosinus sp.]